MPRRYTSRPRGSTKNVEDKQFIAQTVNYATNDGVVWCALTNGLTYRVYKTNEPVAMDQKLLFEVHLTEVADGGVAAAKPLQLLSRASLVNGELGLGASACSLIRVCARRSCSWPLIRREGSSTRSSRPWDASSAARPAQGEPRARL